MFIQSSISHPESSIRQSILSGFLLLSLFLFLNLLYNLSPGSVSVLKPFGCWLFKHFKQVFSQKVWICGWWKPHVLYRSFFLLLQLTQSFLQISSLLPSSITFGIPNFLDAFPIGLPPKRHTIYFWTVCYI